MAPMVPGVSTVTIPVIIAIISAAIAIVVEVLMLLLASNGAHEQKQT